MQAVALGRTHVQHGRPPVTIGPAETVDPRPVTAIVTIGDELLVGDRTDTNASWLARHLTERGLRVELILSVGDDEATIGDALAHATERADVVITTGGLGPTADDRTRDAVAERWNLPLEEDPALLERLRDRQEALGWERPPAMNRRAAEVPLGAEPLRNERGSAPGLHLRIPREGREPASLILLPGIPGEMRGLMEGAAGALILDRFGPRLHPGAILRIHTAGFRESDLAERIEQIRERDDRVTVAYRPSVRGVELRLGAHGPDAAERLDALRERLADLLGPFEFFDPAGNLAGAVGRALERRGSTIAVAESCTGGLVLKRLTDIPGSSGWVLGGIVAYDNRIKRDQLDVPEALIEGAGAVSEDVARAMARGVAHRFGADVGVGVTGIAGPSGAVPGKPVGTTWIAVLHRGDAQATRIVFPGDREEVRERAAQHALLMVLRAMDTRRDEAGPSDANPGDAGG